MGWNGNSGSQNIRWLLSWKDQVGDERVAEFEQRLTGEVYAFIAQKIREEFADEIEDNILTFMAGDFDSY